MNYAACLMLFSPPNLKHSDKWPLFLKVTEVHHSSDVILNACLNKIARCVSILWNRYLEEGIIYEHIHTLGENIVMG